MLQALNIVVALVFVLFQVHYITSLDNTLRHKPELHLKHKQRGKGKNVAIKGETKQHVDGLDIGTILSHDQLHKEDFNYATDDFRVDNRPGIHPVRIETEHPQKKQLSEGMFGDRGIPNIRTDDFHVDTMPHEPLLTQPEEEPHVQPEHPLPEPPIFREDPTPVIRPHIEEPVFVHHVPAPPPRHEPVLIPVPIMAPPPPPPPPPCTVHIPVTVHLKGKLAIRMKHCQKCDFSKNIESIGPLKISSLNKLGDKLKKKINKAFNARKKTGLEFPRDMLGTKRNNPPIVELDDILTKKSSVEFLDDVMEPATKKDNVEEHEHNKGEPIILAKSVTIPETIIPREAYKRGVVISLPKGKAMLKCVVPKDNTQQKHNKKYESKTKVTQEKLDSTMSLLEHLNNVTSITPSEDAVKQSVADSSMNTEQNKVLEGLNSSVASGPSILDSENDIVTLSSQLKGQSAPSKLIGAITTSNQDQQDAPNGFKPRVSNQPTVKETISDYNTNPNNNNETPSKNSDSLASHMKGLDKDLLVTLYKMAVHDIMRELDSQKQQPEHKKRSLRKKIKLLKNQQELLQEQFQGLTESLTDTPYDLSMFNTQPIGINKRSRFPINRILQPSRNENNTRRVKLIDTDRPIIRTGTNRRFRNFASELAANSDPNFYGDLDPTKLIDDSHECIDPNCEKQKQFLQGAGRYFANLDNMALAPYQRFMASKQNVKLLYKKTYKAKEISKAISSKRQSIQQTNIYKKTESEPNTIVELFGTLPKVPLKITLNPKGPLAKLKEPITIDLKPASKSGNTRAIATANDPSVIVNVAEKIFKDEPLDGKQEEKLQSVYADIKKRRSSLEKQPVRSILIDPDRIIKEKHSKRMRIVVSLPKELTRLVSSSSPSAGIYNQKFVAIDKSQSSKKEATSESRLEPKIEEYEHTLEKLKEETKAAMMQLNRLKDPYSDIGGKKRSKEHNKNHNNNNNKNHSSSVKGDPYADLGGVAKRRRRRSSNLELNAEEQHFLNKISEGSKTVMSEKDRYEQATKDPYTTMGSTVSDAKRGEVTRPSSTLTSENTTRTNRTFTNPLGANLTVASPSSSNLTTTTNATSANIASTNSTVKNATSANATKRGILLPTGTSGMSFIRHDENITSVDQQQSLSAQKQRDLVTSVISSENNPMLNSLPKFKEALSKISPETRRRLLSMKPFKFLTGLSEEDSKGENGAASKSTTSNKDPYADMGKAVTRSLNNSTSHIATEHEHQRKRHHVNHNHNNKNALSGDDIPEKRSSQDDMKNKQTKMSADSASQKGENQESQNQKTEPKVQKEKQIGKVDGQIKEFLTTNKTTKIDPFSDMESVQSDAVKRDHNLPTNHKPHHKHRIHKKEQIYSDHTERQDLNKNATQVANNTITHKNTTEVGNNNVTSLTNNTKLSRDPYGEVGSEANIPEKREETGKVENSTSKINGKSSHTNTTSAAAVNNTQHLKDPYGDVGTLAAVPDKRRHKNGPTTDTPKQITDTTSVNFKEDKTKIEKKDISINILARRSGNENNESVKNDQEEKDTKVQQNNRKEKEVLKESSKGMEDISGKAQPYAEDEGNSIGGSKQSEKVRNAEDKTPKEHDGELSKYKTTSNSSKKEVEGKKNNVTQLNVDEDKKRNGTVTLDEKPTEERETKHHHKKKVFKHVIWNGPDPYSELGDTSPTWGESVDKQNNKIKADSKLNIPRVEHEVSQNISSNDNEKVTENQKELDNDKTPESKQNVSTVQERTAQNTSENEGISTADNQIGESEHNVTTGDQTTNKKTSKLDFDPYTQVGSTSTLPEKRKTKTNEITTISKTQNGATVDKNDNSGGDDDSIDIMKTSGVVSYADVVKMAPKTEKKNNKGSSANHNKRHDDDPSGVIINPSPISKKKEKSVSVIKQNKNDEESSHSDTVKSMRKKHKKQHKAEEESASHLKHTKKDDTSDEKSSLEEIPSHYSQKKMENKVLETIAKHIKTADTHPNVVVAQHIKTDSTPNNASTDKLSMPKEINESSTVDEGSKYIKSERLGPNEDTKIAQKSQEETPKNKTVKENVDDIKTDSMSANRGPSMVAVNTSILPFQKTELEAKGIAEISNQNKTESIDPNAVLVNASSIPQKSGGIRPAAESSAKSKTGIVDPYTDVGNSSPTPQKKGKIANKHRYHHQHSHNAKHSTSRSRVTKRNTTSTKCLDPYSSVGSESPTTNRRSKACKPSNTESNLQNITNKDPFSDIGAVLQSRSLKNLKRHVIGSPNKALSMVANENIDPYAHMGTLVKTFEKRSVQRSRRSIEDAETENVSIQINKISPNGGSEKHVTNMQNQKEIDDSSIQRTSSVNGKDDVHKDPYADMGSEVKTNDKRKLQTRKHGKQLKMINELDEVSASTNSHSKSTTAKDPYADMGSEVSNNDKRKLQTRKHGKQLKMINELDEVSASTNSHSKSTTAKDPYADMGSEVSNNDKRKLQTRKHGKQLKMINELDDVSASTNIHSKSTTAKDPYADMGSEVSNNDKRKLQTRKHGKQLKMINELDEVSASTNIHSKSTTAKDPYADMGSEVSNNDKRKLQTRKHGKQLKMINELDEVSASTNSHSKSTTTKDPYADMGSEVSSSEKRKLHHDQSKKRTFLKENSSKVKTINQITKSQQLSTATNSDSKSNTAKDPYADMGAEVKTVDRRKRKRSFKGENQQLQQQVELKRRPVSTTEGDAKGGVSKDPYADMGAEVKTEDRRKKRRSFKESKQEAMSVNQMTSSSTVDSKGSVSKDPYADMGAEVKTVDKRKRRSFRQRAKNEQIKSVNEQPNNPKSTGVNKDHSVSKYSYVDTGAEVDKKERKKNYLPGHAAVTDNTDSKPTDADVKGGVAKDPYADMGSEVKTTDKKKKRSFNKNSHRRPTKHYMRTDVGEYENMIPQQNSRNKFDPYADMGTSVKPSDRKSVVLHSKHRTHDSKLVKRSRDPYADLGTSIGLTQNEAREKPSKTEGAYSSVRPGVAASFSKQSPTTSVTNSSVLSSKQATSTQTSAKANSFQHNPQMSSKPLVTVSFQNTESGEARQSSDSVVIEQQQQNQNMEHFTKAAAEHIGPYDTSDPYSDLGASNKAAQNGKVVESNTKESTSSKATKLNSEQNNEKTNEVSTGERVTGKSEESLSGEHPNENVAKEIETIKRLEKAIQSEKSKVSLKNNNGKEHQSALELNVGQEVGGPYFEIGSPPVKKEIVVTGQKKSTGCSSKKNKGGIGDPYVWIGSEGSSESQRRNELCDVPKIDEGSIGEPLMEEGENSNHEGESREMNSDNASSVDSKATSAEPIVTKDNSTHSSTEDVYANLGTTAEVGDKKKAVRKPEETQQVPDPYADLGSVSSRSHMPKPHSKFLFIKVEDRPLNEIPFYK